MAGGNSAVSLGQAMRGSQGWLTIAPFSGRNPFAGIRVFCRGAVLMEVAIGNIATKTGRTIAANIVRVTLGIGVVVLILATVFAVAGASRLATNDVAARQRVVTQEVEAETEVYLGGLTSQVENLALSVAVSTNGWLEFGGNTSGGASATNTCLPSSAHTNPFLAAYWDDMRTVGLAVRYGTIGSAGGRVFIADFEVENNFSSNHNMTMQVQVHERSSAITVKYLDSEDQANGQTATIGYQTAGGASATVRSITCNGKVLDVSERAGEVRELDPGSFYTHAALIPELIKDLPTGPGHPAVDQMLSPTSPLQPDSDGDGMLDVDERVLERNPFDSSDGTQTPTPNDDGTPQDGPVTSPRQVDPTLPSTDPDARANANDDAVMGGMSDSSGDAPAQPFGETRPAPDATDDVPMDERIVLTGDEPHLTDADMQMVDDTVSTFLPPSDDAPADDWAPIDDSGASGGDEFTADDSFA
jgi:hypothetical protein